MEGTVLKKYILVLLIAVIAFSAVAAPKDDKQEIQKVRVVNLPDKQNIDGSVAVKGLIKHSFLDRRLKIIIPPVARNETSLLIEVDPLITDGFTSVILSFQGEVKNKTFSPGTVGAMLIPDEKPVISALKQDKEILFPLEVSSEVAPGPQRYFTSEYTKQIVGFPKYRIYLYNSTNNSVEMNLYMYLTN